MRVETLRGNGFLIDNTQKISCSDSVIGRSMGNLPSIPVHMDLNAWALLQVHLVHAACLYSGSWAKLILGPFHCRSFVILYKTI